MKNTFVLSNYISQAMARANYEKLEDGSYAGTIPECQGVLAFASNKNQCQTELQSVLEDWILLGLKLKHPLPVIAGINLNEEPNLEPVDAL